MLARFFDFLLAQRAVKNRFPLYTSRTADRLDKALVQASEKGDIGEVRRLLWRGACVGHINALEQAANNGHAACVALLLRCGAKVHAGNALNGAIDNNHLATVALLITHCLRHEPTHVNHSEIYSVLYKVVKRNQYDMAALCLEFYPHIKKNSQYVVEWAARNNDMPMLRLLLKHGANPTYGLAVAAAENDMIMLNFLLAQGADPTHNNSIALQWACLHECSDTFDILYPLSDAKAALNAMHDNQYLDVDCRMLDQKMHTERQREQLCVAVDISTHVPCTDTTPRTRKM